MTTAAVSKKISHIAVMRLSAMGDVAMTVPVLRAFVRQYPEVKITMISRPFFEPLFAEIPNVSFFPFDEKGRHKGFLGLLRLFQDLQSLGIDAFADLHNVLRSKIIRTLWRWNGKKTATLDKGRAEKKTLTRVKNKIFRPLTPMVKRQAEVFAALGFAVDLSQPHFAIPQNLAVAMTHLTGEKTKIWIGIAPFAQYDSKTYPLDLMEKVIDVLALDDNYKIFLFGGGKREIKVLDMLAEEHKNTFNVAGKFKFKEELQLIGHLDIMLSMDSGNGHLAALFGVKVITLWGATHPFAGFMPFDQPIENALVSDRVKFPKLPTSVYGNKKIAGYENAMRTILPEMVVEKIKSVLQSGEN